MIFKSKLPILFPPPDLMHHLKTMQRFLTKKNRGILITEGYTVGVDHLKGVLHKGIMLNKQNNPSLLHQIHIPCSEFKRRYSPKAKDNLVGMTVDRLLFKSGKFLQFNQSLFPDLTSFKKADQFISVWGLIDMKKYLFHEEEDFNFYKINDITLCLNRQTLVDLFTLYPYKFDMHYSKDQPVLFSNKQLTIVIGQGNYE